MMPCGALACVHGMQQEKRLKKNNVNDGIMILQKAIINFFLPYGGRLIVHRGYFPDACSAMLTFSERDEHNKLINRDERKTY